MSHMRSSFITIIAASYQAPMVARPRAIFVGIRGAGELSSEAGYSGRWWVSSRVSSPCERQTSHLTTVSHRRCLVVVVPFDQCQGPQTLRLHIQGGRWQSTSGAAFVHLKGLGSPLADHAATSVNGLSLLSTGVIGHWLRRYTYTKDVNMTSCHSSDKARDA